MTTTQHKNRDEAPTTDKLVTHEDLPMLRSLREHGHGGDRMAAIVDALIAAAEADMPPLPEGWVLYTPGTGGNHVLYCRPTALGGTLHRTDGVDAPVWANVDRVPRDQLTPLRPTVTEADIEKAARAASAAYFEDLDDWDSANQRARDDWMKATRATLDALGIEVQA